jgi:multidrug efflux pump subunit AcrA (membrane-fusion protein)
MLTEKATPRVEPNGVADGPGRPSRSARAPRRRRAMLLAVALVLLLGVLVVRAVGLGSRAPSTPPAVQVAPLVAHGQVQPTRQAHVGTLAGGIVQQLVVSVGSELPRQAVVAWVLSPSSTEIVTAPLAGTVTNVLVHEGDTLAPGATLVVVADLEALQVELTDVDEFSVTHVQLGQPLQVTLDALDDAVVEGVVTSIALLPQPTTATGNAAYPVIVSLSGLPPELRAGMSVRATLP